MVHYRQIFCAGLLFIGTLPVFANLPPVDGLDIPSITSETLHPADKATFIRTTTLFHPTLPINICAVIYCIPSFGSRATALLISKDSKDGFSIVEYSISSEATIDGVFESPKIAELPIETQLANRIIALIKHELQRAVPERNESCLIMDGARYYFYIPVVKSELLGETAGGCTGTTIARLCQTVDYLSALIATPESERVRLLNEIDQSVTAIEIAYKVAH